MKLCYVLLFVYKEPYFRTRAGGSLGSFSIGASVSQRSAAWKLSGWLCSDEFVRGDIFWHNA